MCQAGACGLSVGSVPRRVICFERLSGSKVRWSECSLLYLQSFFFTDFCEHVNYRKTVFLKINSRKQQYNMPKVKTKSRNHAIDQLAIFEICF